MISDFVSGTLSSIIAIASIALTFFLIKGGYLYMTSRGDPEALEDAKKTIRNAIIGLVIVIAASTLSSIFTQSFFESKTPSFPEAQTVVKDNLKVNTPSSSDYLKEVIIGLLREVASSAVSPIINGVVKFLTNTPSVVENSVVFNFWIRMVAIVDGLFALVIALVGLQFMSASSFGFEEIELKKLLPRLGLTFLAINTSIFIVDWLVKLANVLVNSIITTQQLTDAWTRITFDVSTFSGQNFGIITLVFAVVFLIVASILLLAYITRLIIIVLGAVLSPFIFLLWSLPKFSDFADLSIRIYLTNIFSVFVHVVIIYLAAMFMSTLLDKSEGNQLLSILFAIGLVVTLLKVQSSIVQMMFYNTSRGIIKKVGAQITNVALAKKLV